MVKLRLGSLKLSAGFFFLGLLFLIPPQSMAVSSWDPSRGGFEIGNGRLGRFLNPLGRFRFEFPKSWQGSYTKFTVDLTAPSVDGRAPTKVNISTLDMTEEEVTGSLRDWITQPGWKLFELDGAKGIRRDLPLTPKVVHTEIRLFKPDGAAFLFHLSSEGDPDLRVLLDTFEIAPEKVD